MKSLLFATVLTLSFTAFGAEREAGEKPFEEIKKMMVETTDLRIAHLQAHKTCVASAADRDLLRKCKEDLRAKRKDMKEAWNSKREANKAIRDTKRSMKKK